MGAELLDSEGELLTDYLRQAEAASGQPIRKVMLEGPMEALTRTEVAQPALFCVALAVTDAARARGLQPDLVAGHSLGEYTAAAASGAISVEDGIELVSLRGRLMGEIGDERPGAMAAVIGLDADKLGTLCEEAAAAGMVTLANINSPTQIVVSGEEDGVAKLMELAEEAGASRVVKLQVAAAFHSELMKPVQEQMAEAVARRRLVGPSCPGRFELARRNRRRRRVPAGRARRADRVARFAGSSACRRWSAPAQRTFLEPGPGRVLGGLVRQIHPDADVFSADSPARLDEFAAEHS